MKAYITQYSIAWLCVYAVMCIPYGCKQATDKKEKQFVDSLCKNYEIPAKRLEVIQTLLTQVPVFGKVDAEVAAKKYNLLADYYNKVERNSYAAYAYSDTAVQAIEKIAENNKELYLQISLRHSNILFDLNRTDDGFESFFRSKRIIEKSFDSCYLVRFYDKISHGLYANRKYIQAIKYYHRSIDLIKECPVYTEREVMYQLQGNYDNIALSYERIGEHDKADSFYKVALAYIENFEKTHPNDSAAAKWRLDMSKSVILGNLGSNSLLQKQYKNAVDYLLYSLKLSVNNDHLAIDHQFNLIKLATAYLKLSDLGKTDSVLAVLKERMKLTTDYEVEVRLKNFLWQYYGETKQYEQAFKVRQEYQVYKDSLNNALLLLANKIDFETELTNTSNRITLDELNRKNGQFTIWMMFLGAMLIMTLFVVLLIRKNQLLLKQSYEQQKQLNRQILEQNKHLESNVAVLEQSQNDNNKVIKILSHDLRTPLSSMHGLMGLLKNDSNLHADQLKLVMLAQQTSKDALLLIENLLKTYTTIGNDVKTAIVISDLVTYCVDMLQPKAAEKQINIINNVQAVTLFINRERIWRVFANLLTNAIKFSAVGGTVTINSQTTDTHIVISVHDTGIGIPPNMIETLFSNGLQHNRTGTAGEVS
ncbi:MAG: sensor histidine kinase, partial [Sphingobacteriales bacterium]